MTKRLAATFRKVAASLFVRLHIMGILLLSDLTRGANHREHYCLASHGCQSRHAAGLTPFCWHLIPMCAILSVGEVCDPLEDNAQ